MSGVPLPSRTIPESFILIRDPATLPYRVARREPEQIAESLCPDQPVALIQNEGAMALGRNLLEAFDRLEVLEATAAAVIASHRLGELATMGDRPIAELKAVFFPNGGL